MKQDLSQLISLREQLSRFHILACGLKHEEVIKAAHESVNGHPDFPDHKFLLHGLCSKSVRNQTLSCAHSMAAVYYERLLFRVNSFGVLESVERLSDALKKQLLVIYLLDHEKGNLEKKLAVLALEGTHQETEEIVKSLRKLKNDHSVAVAKIKKIHQQVMQYLDQYIYSLTYPFE